MSAQHLVISLVYSLGDSLWMAAVLWLCYLFINWLLPLQSKHAYRLASILLTTLFIGWLAVFIFYLAGGQLVGSPAFHQLPRTNYFSIPQMWVYVAAFLYLLGLSYHLIRYFFIDYRVRQLLKKTVSVTGEWKLVVDRHTGRFSRQRSIRTFLSDRVSSPLTFGWIRPVILFPVAAINNLTINEFESILLHELAHIRRNDFLLQRVLALMEMTMFFNLFARDLCRTIRRLREEACDDEVLAAGTLPLDYVTALGWCARQGIAFGGTLGAVGTEPELLNRILRMTQGKSVRSTPATHVLWMALLGIVVGTQFSTLLPPTSSGTIIPLSVSAATQSTTNKKPQQDRKLTAAVFESKKVVQQSLVRKKLSDRMIEKKSAQIESVEIESPLVSRTVGWQERNDLITVEQEWNQIRRLSREELSQLIREALQDFDVEDKISWIRLVSNKLLAQEMNNYSGDSSWMSSRGYGVDEGMNQPEESRLQKKLMILIWMKWREKHPTFMEHLLHKHATDSSTALSNGEQ